MNDQFAGRLAAQHGVARPRHEQRRPVRQEVEAQRQGLVPDDDLDRATVIDSQDLTGDPVGEPQPTAVPAWRFHEAPTGDQRQQDQNFPTTARATRIAFSAGAVTTVLITTWVVPTLNVQAQSAPLSYL